MMLAVRRFTVNRAANQICPIFQTFAWPQLCPIRPYFKVCERTIPQRRLIATTSRLRHQESKWQKRHIEDILSGSRNSNREMREYKEAYVAKVRRSWEDMRKHGMSNEDIRIKKVGRYNQLVGYASSTLSSCLAFNAGLVLAQETRLVEYGQQEESKREKERAEWEAKDKVKTDGEIDMDEKTL